MKIPTERTRRDMEMAAELRAAGATWETIGAQLKRQPNVVMRWATVYRDEWERMYQEAEERNSRLANNESRSVMRALLRHKNSKTKMSAADKLAKRRQAELAAQARSRAKSDLPTVLQEIEEISDDEIQCYIDEYLEHRRGQSAASAAAGTGADATGGGGGAGPVQADAAGLEGAAGAAGPG